MTELQAMQIRRQNALHYRQPMSEGKAFLLVIGLVVFLLVAGIIGMMN